LGPVTKIAASHSLSKLFNGSMQSKNNCDQIKDNKMGRACITHENGNVYNSLVQIPECRRTTGRPRGRWHEQIPSDIT
jgi:hypothetical protein